MQQQSQPIGLDSCYTAFQDIRYRLFPVTYLVERFKYYFESEDIAITQRVEGKNTIADVLTKRDMNTFEKSNWTCALEYLYSKITDEAERFTTD